MSGVLEEFSAVCCSLSSVCTSDVGLSLLACLSFFTDWFSHFSIIFMLLIVECKFVIVDYIMKYCSFIFLILLIDGVISMSVLFELDGCYFTVGWLAGIGWYFAANKCWLSMYGEFQIAFYICDRPRKITL